MLEAYEIIALALMVTAIVFGNGILDKIYDYICNKRIKGLLEANSKLVMDKRGLKVQLRSDRDLFAYYAQEHRAKMNKLIDSGDRSSDTEQAVDFTRSKMHRNANQVEVIDEILVVFG